MKWHMKGKAKNLTGNTNDYAKWRSKINTANGTQ